REICDCDVRDEIMLKSFDRVNGDYNDFWAGRDYLHDLGPVRAATLMAHAFNDWNVMPEHSVRIALALKKQGVPVQMYFHQGGHGGAPPFAVMNKWFTRYLYGVNNDIEEEPRAWIVREGGSRRKPTAYEDYPHPQASPVTVRPVAETGSLARKADGKQGRASFTDDVEFSGAELAQKELPHRLLYRTAPLEVPLHLSGTARLELRLAVDRPAANLSVWLVSLPWTESRRITDNIVTRGWADPQNHGSLTESEPLEPGEYYDLAFDLQPDDQIIPKGQQLALMIFSSDRDFTLWPNAGTELTIDLDATRLTLPVVGGEAAFDAAVQKTRDL
ncbi:MAG: CocE/NonD family hydrolase C-terminal non-catalytic domain-containing protein, partial [Planctomycetota bacterium]